MSTERRYTIDGVTYHSLDEMPPDVRRRWDSLSPLLRAGNLSDLSLTGAPTPSAGQVAASWAVTGMVVAMAILALLSMLSSVRPTVHYGAGLYGTWCAAVLFILIAGWRKRDRVLAKFRAQGGGTVKVAFRVAAAIAGLTVLSGVGILGGLPVVAHYVTARPGDLIVTVDSLRASTPRGGCTGPAVGIAQFTYWMRNYLCLSPQAFAAARIGSRLRLRGSVSSFGIVVDSYQWGDLPEFNLFRPEERP